MAELFPVAGAKIYIGGVLATKKTDFVAGDFTSQTWVEIDGWSAAGMVGDESAMISKEIINRNRDVQQKGTRKAKVMENRFVINSTDAGQIALIAAEAVKSNYAFKIEYADILTTTGSIRYLIGLVTDVSEVNGEANVLREMNGTLAVNSNLVRVAAA